MRGQVEFRQGKPRGEACGATRENGGG
jgi:hypothetical protein